MVLTEIYRKNFKKAAVFLYPLLGLSRKVSFKPNSVWIGMDNYIRKEDQKLICIYDTSVQNFDAFSNKVLRSRENLLEEIRIDESKNAFVFDYSKFAQTWNAYLNAKFSQFEEDSKKTILNYYSDNSANALYLNSYLYPEKFFDQYAKFLEVNVGLLKEVGELCSKPDFDSERLRLEAFSLG